VLLNFILLLLGSCDDQDAMLAELARVHGLMMSEGLEAATRSEKGRRKGAA